MVCTGVGLIHPARSLILAKQILSSVMLTTLFVPYQLVTISCKLCIHARLLCVIWTNEEWKGNSRTVSTTYNQGADESGPSTYEILGMSQFSWESDENTKTAEI